MNEEEVVGKESRTWGMVCHLAALSICLGIPFGNIIGPLIVWLIKRDELPFVAEEGKESLNFQISMTIYAAIAALLSFAVIGIPILIALAIADLVLVIKATISANDGRHFRYPITLRLIK